MAIVDNFRFIFIGGCALICSSFLSSLGWGLEEKSGNKALRESDSVLYIVSKIRVVYYYLRLRCRIKNVEEISTLREYYTNEAIV